MDMCVCVLDLFVFDEPNHYLVSHAAAVKDYILSK